MSLEVARHPPACLNHDLSLSLPPAACRMRPAALLQPPKPGSSSPADAFYAALMRGEGGYQDPAPGLRPIFVVGMPRSGSTLIEQILASHSQARRRLVLLTGLIWQC